MILNVDKQAKKYIEFIRNKKCTACYNSPADPDHLITIGMGNNRKKATVKDFSCIPLCRLCHIERGQIGDKKFQEKSGINIWKDLNKYLMEFLTR